MLSFVVPERASSAIQATPAPGGDDTLVELWLRLKTSEHSRRAYRSEADRFRRFCANPLAAVRLTDLAAYAEQLGQGSLAPSSQNRALTAIKSLFSFAHRTGYLTFNPGAALRTRPARDALAQRILTEQEVARMIEAATPGRDRVLLRLLYASGVRVSEAAALEWRDIEPRGAAGQISVFGKGGRTRQVLLGESAWSALWSLRPAEADSLRGPVFRSQRGGALDVSQIRRIVYAAARRAGLERAVSPHWMRHAHASHALDRGAPIHLVQQTLGHATIATTGRYLHARPADSSSRYLEDSAEVAGTGRGVS